jgi:hypothetical protein
MATMGWQRAKATILELYGEQWDGEVGDDPCFYCPECEEPIYKEDFPKIEIGENGRPVCPVCETELT